MGGKNCGFIQMGLIRFQTICHFASSLFVLSINQYTTPFTHHLRAELKTHHITTSTITPHKLNNFNSQDFRRCPFLTYNNIIYIILTEIIFHLLWSDDTTNHTESCILAIISPWRWPKQRPKHFGDKSVIKTHHKALKCILFVICTLQINSHIYHSFNQSQFLCCN
jgi:hypothetical protein